jgi:hypothetical protein
VGSIHYLMIKRSMYFALSLWENGVFVEIPVQPSTVPSFPTLHSDVGRIISRYLKKKKLLPTIVENSVETQESLSPKHSFQASLTPVDNSNIEPLDFSIPNQFWNRLWVSPCFWRNTAEYTNSPYLIGFVITWGLDKEMLPEYTTVESRNLVESKNLNSFVSAQTPRLR